MCHKFKSLKIDRLVQIYQIICVFPAWNWQDPFPLKIPTLFLNPDRTGWSDRVNRKPDPCPVRVRQKIRNRVGSEWTGQNRQNRWESVESAVGGSRWPSLCVFGFAVGVTKRASTIGKRRFALLMYCLILRWWKFSNVIMQISTWFSGSIEELLLC